MGAGFEFPPAPSPENTTLVSAEIRCLYPFFQRSYFHHGLIGAGHTESAISNSHSR